MSGLDSQRKDRGSQSRLTHSLMVAHPGMAGGPHPNPNSEDIPNIADSIQEERCSPWHFAEKKKKKIPRFSFFCLMRNGNKLKGLKFFHGIDHFLWPALTPHCPEVHSTLLLPELLWWTPHLLNKLNRIILGSHRTFSCKACRLGAACHQSSSPWHTVHCSSNEKAQWLSLCC